MCSIGTDPAGGSVSILPLLHDRPSDTKHEVEVTRSQDHPAMEQSTSKFYIQSRRLQRSPSITDGIRFPRSSWISWSNCEFLYR